MTHRWKGHDKCNKMRPNELCSSSRSVFMTILLKVGFIFRSQPNFNFFEHFYAPFDPWGAPKWVKYSSMEKMDATMKFLMLNIISD